MVAVKSEAMKMSAFSNDQISHSDFASDPYAHLAAAIIIKAFEDLQIVGNDDKCYV